MSSSKPAVSKSEKRKKTKDVDNEAPDPPQKKLKSDSWVQISLIFIILLIKLFQFQITNQLLESLWTRRWNRKHWLESLKNNCRIVRGWLHDSISVQISEGFDPKLVTIRIAGNQKHNRQCKTHRSEIAKHVEDAGKRKTFNRWHLKKHQIRQVHGRIRTSISAVQTGC